MALGTDSWAAVVSDGSLAMTTIFDTMPLLDRWVHLAVVVDRDDEVVRTYVDGVQKDAASAIALGSLSTDAEATIGGIATGDSQDFLGVIDEVRIYGGALSPDTLAVQHANLRAPATFLEVGPEEP